MAVNFFQTSYAFLMSRFGVFARDEQNQRIQCSEKALRSLISHLEQMAKTTHLYRSQKEIDRCITNLSGLEKIAVFRVLARHASQIFRELKSGLPSDEERIGHLVDSLYRFLPLQSEDERQFRAETLVGLHEAKENDPAYSVEWALLEELIAETASAQQLPAALLKQQILAHVESGKEDLLYLLHLSIGGLLSQEGSTPRLREIKGELQKKYEAWQRAAAAKATTLFSEGKSFEEVLHAVQVGRQQIAYTCYHFPPDPFGRRRNAPLYTPIEGKYLSLLPKIVKLADQPFQTIRGFEDFDELDTSAMRTVTIYGEIGGRERPLTSFIVSNRHLEADSYREVMYSDEPGEDAPGYQRAVICHAPPQAYSLVINHLNRRTRSFLEQGRFSLSRAAEIHWLFAHLCPLDRGSAAVGEVILQALFQVKGVEIEWKRDNPPDLILLTSPSVPDAVQGYSESFRQIIPS